MDAGFRVHRAGNLGPYQSLFELPKEQGNLVRQGASSGGIGRSEQAIDDRPTDAAALIDWRWYEDTFPPAYTTWSQSPTPVGASRNAANRPRPTHVAGPTIRRRGRRWADRDSTARTQHRGPRARVRPGAAPARGGDFAAFGAILIRSAKRVEQTGLIRGVVTGPRTWSSISVQQGRSCGLIEHLRPSRATEVQFPLRLGERRESHSGHRNR
jgi:hypothetical protein